MTINLINQTNTVHMKLNNWFGIAINWSK